MAANANRVAKVLLCGAGRMGQIRASALFSNPRFKTTAVVDSNLSSASALAAKYHIPNVFPTLEAALGSTEMCNDLDGVIVSTPTFTHNSVFRTASEAGLHIFTEKPVDETAAQIKDIFDMTNKHNVALCCGFQRRFDDSYVAVKNAIDANKIGTPTLSSVVFADHPVPPIEFLKTGGDIFMDLAPHDVDFILWCMDDEVVDVFATGSSSIPELAECNVLDNATMLMRMKKGGICTISMSRSASYGYDQRCEIFGTHGTLSVMNHPKNSALLGNKSGFHSALLQHSFPERFKQGFGSEMDAFADVLLEGKEWPVDMANCMKVQKVADAAKRSAQENRVVRLEVE